MDKKSAPKRPALMAWTIRAKVKQAGYATVMAKTAEEAMEKFDAMEWEEFQEDGVEDWEALGEPQCDE